MARRKKQLGLPKVMRLEAMSSESTKPARARKISTKMPSVKNLVPKLPSDGGKKIKPVHTKPGGVTKARIVHAPTPPKIKPPKAIKAVKPPKPKKGA